MAEFTVNPERFVSVLDIRIRSRARSRRQRGCGGDRAHHARERRLGTGSIGKGARRAVFRKTVINSVGPKLQIDSRV